MSFREVIIGPCRLINADCMDVLPTLDPVDAVVTDPPYEGMKGGTTIKWGGGVSPQRAETITLGNELGDARALSLVSSIARCGAIVFCSYHWIERCAALTGGTRKALLTWYKRNSPASVQNSPWYETEFAWAIQFGPGIEWRTLRTMLEHPLLQAGCMAVERICENGKSIHPAQKPVALMRDVILPGMDSVCDPYMGLGTTGVACVQMGRKFVGIEREPKYFDVAVSRIQRAWELKCSELPFPADDEKPASLRQRELIGAAE